jgi:hypothetical protein
MLGPHTIRAGEFGVDFNFWRHKTEMVFPVLQVKR